MVAELNFIKTITYRVAEVSDTGGLQLPVSSLPWIFFAKDRFKTVRLLHRFEEVLKPVALPCGLSSIMLRAVLPIGPGY